LARRDAPAEEARAVTSPAPAADAARGPTPASTGAVGATIGADADVGERLAEAPSESPERAAATAEPTGWRAAAPVAPALGPDSGSTRHAVTTVDAVAERDALADLAPAPRVLPESSSLADEVAGGIARLDTLAFPRTAAEAKQAVAAAPRRQEEVAAKNKAVADQTVGQPTAPAAQELGRSREGLPSQLMRAAQRADVPVLSAGSRSTSLSVPGLEVLSVTAVEGEGLAGAVRVRQRLADGDTLELVSLPPGTDPAALEPVEGDGRTELVLPRDGGWLVVRAHASRESLLELVRRMEGDR
jgi:hypothetical protein